MRKRDSADPVKAGVAIIRNVFLRSQLRIALKHGLAAMHLVSRDTTLFLEAL